MFAPTTPLEHYMTECFNGVYDSDYATQTETMFKNMEEKLELYRHYRFSLRVWDDLRTDINLKMPTNKYEQFDDYHDHMLNKFASESAKPVSEERKYQLLTCLEVLNFQRDYTYIALCFSVIVERTIELSSIAKIPDVMSIICQLKTALKKLRTHVEDFTKSFNISQEDALCKCLK